jgi:hypothetical protein
MAISLNGWTAIRFRADPRLRTIKVPGTKRSVTVARNAAPLFAAFLRDWNERMPDRLKLDKGPLDGWNYRPSRLEKGLSNHASGSAVDARYDVLKPDGKKHMTVAEKKILDGILAQYVTADGHRVLANGAWWKTVDEMHTELSQGWDRGAKRMTTSRDVVDCINYLKIDKNGVRPL